MTLSQLWRTIAVFVPIAVSSFQPMLLSSSSNCHSKKAAPAFGTSLSATETASPGAGIDGTNATEFSLVSSSNLSVLDHLNFNVPNHEFILDFYLGILGFGLDPKVAVNLMPDTDQRFGREGLIWASCGPNQFHFPRDPNPQFLSGTIGLRYRSLEGLLERLARAVAGNNSNCNSNNQDRSEQQKRRCFESYEVFTGARGETVVEIKDWYGNVFQCREGPEKQPQYHQSVVRIIDHDRFGDVAKQWGVPGELSDCRGIDFVEFDCKVGTAPKIARFYESVLDAPTAVTTVGDYDDEGRVVARVFLGERDVVTGAFPQELRFKETVSELPPYDGHHLAIYIEDIVAFERAFGKAHAAGLLTTNWRDKADVLTLEAARSEHQFRITDLVEDATGEPVFRLEHEIRSIKHPAWPGRKR